MKNNLSNFEYMKAMYFSDFIILPYSSKLYKSRTSGIFIEDILSKNFSNRKHWMLMSIGGLD